MNYEPLYELANEAIEYMNPENDWRFIHADSYCFYNLLPNQKMTSSFPLWEELHNEIFSEIRGHLGLPDAVINNFTLVKATPYTICHPIRNHCGIITLDGEAYAAIRGLDHYIKKEGWTEADAYQRTCEMADRAMHIHAPHLVRWGDQQSFGFNVAVGEKPLFPGNRCMNFYPKEGTMFYYYRINPPGAPDLSLVRNK